MKKIILILSSIIIYNCGDSKETESGWTSQDRDDFVSECNVDGNVYDYCNCFFDALSSRYPNSEATEFISDDEMMEIALDCYEYID